MIDRATIDRATGNVTHERLAVLLVNLGWESYAGKPDLYSRWRRQGDSGHILLPLNPEMADYRELLREAVAKLAISKTPHVDRLILRLSAGMSLRDEVRFRKEVSTSAGTVSWPLGEELILSARKALIAAAKSRKSRRAYFGNRNAKFAQSYLSSVLMGQTDIGSYVVTALPPVDQIFPEKEAPSDQAAIHNIAGYTGRDITKSMVTALESTREALDHYRNTGSLAAFEAGVKHGISYELTQAVGGLVNETEGADITVEWDAFSAEGEAGSLIKLEFDGGERSALISASNRLAATAEPELVRVTGTVTLLQRPKPGDPGIIRLHVLSGSHANKLRVRLPEELYELALDAHRDDLAIAVTGRQEREGAYYWLYDPSDIDLVPIPQHAVDEIPGQETAFPIPTVEDEGEGPPQLG